MQFAINIRWDERTMKILFRTVLKFAPVLLLLIGGVATAMAQGAKLQLDQLDTLANKASETVDVKLDEHLMQTTAKFFSGKDTDDAEIRGLEVISAEPKEFTVVNIVGPINLEKLSQLEGSFGVPFLNLPPSKPKTGK